MEGSSTPRAPSCRPGSTPALAAGLQLVGVPDLKPSPAGILSRASDHLTHLGQAQSYLHRWFAQGRWRGAA